MGLAEALLGKDNPFAKFVGENRNTIRGFGAGLAQGPNFSDGLSAAVAGGNRMAPLDDAMAEQRRMAEEQAATQNQTMEWIKANYPEFAALPVEQGFGLAAAEHARRRSAEMGGADPTRYGLTPIWGKFPDGSMGYGVTGSDGTFKPVDTGGFTPLDPYALASDKAAGSATGKGTAEAALSAPGDIGNAEMALDILNQIENFEGIDWKTGAMSMLNVVPGTPGFAFNNLVEQAKSGAFLTAIQQLKGMGALSNMEGAAATAAVTRMNTGLGKDAFLKAVADYRAVVNQGLERAKAKLGGAPGGGAAAVGGSGAPAAGGGFKILGVE